jgi:hypothetical protein
MKRGLGRRLAVGLLALSGAAFAEEPAAQPTPDTPERAEMRREIRRMLTVDGNNDENQARAYDDLEQDRQPVSGQSRDEKRAKKSPVDESGNLKR